MKDYRIKVTCCAFGVWTEKVRIVSESKLLEMENSKNGTYSIEIMEVYENA